MIGPALAVASACKVATGARRAGRIVELGRRVEVHRAPALNLLPGERAEVARASRLNRSLALVALALLAAALAIPLQRQRVIAADLEREVAAAKEAAQQSVRLRDRLAQQLDANARFLTDQKRRMPMVTRILAKLARVIPDQAYVEQIDLTEGQAQPAGPRRHGIGPDRLARAVGAVSRGRSFAHRLRRDPRVGLERFQLSAEVGRWIASDAPPRLPRSAGRWLWPSLARCCSWPTAWWWRRSSLPTGRSAKRSSSRSSCWNAIAV